MAAVRALGVRVVVWGGLACVVLWYSGSLRGLFTPGASPRPVEPTAESEVEGGPTWPHLRGPAYCGVSKETGLADSWPRGGPPLIWKQEIGRGYSGLIAVGNRVFTQRQTATEQSVVCLDAETGNQVWEHRYGWAYEPGGMYPGPRATPTWHAGRVYFAGPDGLVRCLRADNGARLWSVNVNEQYGGRGTEFGYACSPLVEAGKVILPVGGARASVVALDAQDGSTVWASGSQPASYCSALPITLGGRRLVAAFLQNALALLDLESGKLVWQQPYSVGYDEHAAMPLYDEPHLMVMLPFKGGADLYRLNTAETADRDSRRTGFQPVRDGSEGCPTAARLLWHSSELSNDTASSVLVAGNVYGFDLVEAQANGRRPSRGKFKCLDFLSGRVHWSTDRVGHATIAVAEGKLFLFNDKGELILARAAPDRYEELGRTQVFRGEICWTAPALCGGRVYLRSPTHAACLDVRRADPSQQAQPDRATPAPEPPAGDPFDFVRILGKEREYPFDPPDLAEFTRWYVWSLVGPFWGAGVLALLARLILRSRAGGPEQGEPRRESCEEAGARRFAPSVLHEAKPGWTIVSAVFWLSAFLLGLLTTPLANRLSDGFVFTLPASVFVVHQMVLTAVVRSGRRSDAAPPRWVAPAAVFAFVLACLAYYDLCRRLNLAVAWVFLAGFLPSWLLTVPIARQYTPRGGAFLQFVGLIAAFSLFFWASAGCLWAHALLVR